MDFKNGMMTVFVCLPLLSLLFFLLPKKFQSSYNLLLTVAVAAVSSYFAITVISSGIAYKESLPLSFWGSQIELNIDLLSAVFILIVNFTVITGAWFAIEYMRMYKDRKKMDFRFISFRSSGYCFLCLWFA